MRILILTAGYGEGHNAAARSLQAASEEMGVSARIVDLFATTCGFSYPLSRASYLEMINHAPRLWAWLFWLIHRFPLAEFSMPALSRMRDALAELITEEKPTAVISVYPIYGYLVEQLYAHPSERTFGFHTVITDSITINSVWHRCLSDTFLVPNEASAAVLRKARLEPSRIHAFGFPVPPRFAGIRAPRPQLREGGKPRVLYMINSGKKLAPRVVARLLRRGDLHLTVTVGRDERLRAEMEHVARIAGQPIEIHGWTETMPELLMTHHVLIGKAGGAAVQEAIAACTPMIITQVVPGQEEGNAQLLLQQGCAAICESPEAIGAQLDELFAHKAAQWRLWVERITRLSRPAAAQEIVQFVLQRQGLTLRTQPATAA